MKNERKLTLKVDGELYGWFSDFCKSRGLAMSKVVREYLENLRRLVEGKKEADKE